MKFKFIISLTAILLLFLSGCATVPMASAERDLSRKSFKKPPSNVSGLYVYRDSHFGAALKKKIYVDGKEIGETAPKTYFYKDILPGTRKIATESEFGKNVLTLNAESGKNYFVRQYIKMGLFVGGSNLSLVSEDVGKKGVLACKLAE